MAMIDLEESKGTQIMARLLFAVLALSASMVSASAQEFPLTIETKFGTTVIEERPNRIATLDFNGADDLLAMGVQPVAIRHWYGDFPKTVWPWAAPLLTTEPVVLARNLDIEAIAASEPDIILAMWSGIDQRAFDQLSQIAPVVAVPDGVGDYEMPWDARALRAGRAMGMEEAAERTVADINAQFDAALAANPNWNGLTATVAFLWNGRLGVYGAADIRPQVLARMGLETSDGVNDIDGTIDDSTKIYSMAGAEDQNPTKNTPQLIDLIESAGMVPLERDTIYNILHDYSQEEFQPEVQGEVILNG